MAKSHRQRRYEKLKEFLYPDEARELSTLSWKTSATRTALKHIRKDRETIVNSLTELARYEEWSQKRLKQELKDAIKFEYDENGWYRKGEASVWEMLEAYIKKYAKRSPKKPHHPVKGQLGYQEYREQVNLQRRQFRERQSQARE